jgi:hypothetical protein
MRQILLIMVAAKVAFDAYLNGNLFVAFVIGGMAAWVYIAEKLLAYRASRSAP